jgi:tetratricopeptide (TPR) repeat protein
VDKKKPKNLDPTPALSAAIAAENAGDHPQAIQSYTALLAQIANHPADATLDEARLTAVRERGRLLNFVGEEEAAIASYQHYQREAAPGRYTVEALVLMGNQYCYMGQYQQAIETLQEALQLAEASNYTAGRAKGYGGLGLTHVYLGRPEEALTYLTKSLALLEQLGDTVEQARTWNRVGVTHMRLGQVDKAIVALREAATLARQKTNADSLAFELTIHTLNNLGECFQYLFDMEQALIYHHEGLALAAGKMFYLEADLCRNIGVELCYLDRVAEGIDYLHRSLKLAQSINQYNIAMQALFSLALAEIQQGDLVTGYQHARQLKDKAEQGHARGDLADALYALGLYHRLSGDPDTAQQLWQQALFLAHETARRMLLWQIHAELARVTTNPQLAGVHNRIAAEIIQQIAYPIADKTLRDHFLQAAPVASILNPFVFDPDS